VPCSSSREGKRAAKIGDFTAGVVALDESTRCVPDQGRRARYRELQALQDELSLAVRGVFARHRAMVGGRT